MKNNDFQSDVDDFWPPSDVQGEAKWAPNGESPVLESLRRDIERAGNGFWDVLSRGDFA